MKLTRERKIFLGVLGTAVAALTVDQAFLAPSGASAMPMTTMELQQGGVPTDLTPGVEMPAVQSSEAPRGRRRRRR